MHWVLVVVSFDYRLIRMYNSYSADDHDATVISKIKKQSELLPVYTANTDLYKRKGIDIKTHTKYKDVGSTDFFETFLCRRHLATIIWESVSGSTDFFETFLCRRHLATIIWESGL